MHPTIRYRAGNEHSADSPFGRTDLRVAPDGQVRLDFFTKWSHRAWAGTVTPEIVERLHAALASSTFPAPLPHVKPVPAGSDTRVLGTETAEVSIPWHGANELPGYRETFALLDALVGQLCADFGGVRQTVALEVGEQRTVLSREGHETSVWRFGTLYRLPGLAITALDRVTVNGRPLDSTLVFNGEYELIAERGELTWHEGPPAPDCMPEADSVGAESVGAELPFMVESVTETWVGHRFLGGIELHGQAAPKRAFRRRPEPPSLLIAIDAGRIDLPTREAFDARLRGLDTETHQYDATPPAAVAR